MAAPRTGLNPATNSVGFTAKLVTVRSVSADGLTAVTVDRQNTETRVPMLVQRSKAPLPAPGETWLITQDLGMWTFAAFVAVSPSDFVTVPGAAPAWQAMTLLSGWKVQAGSYARYKLLKTEVWIQAKLAAGTIANGIRIWAPPAGCAPVLTHAQTGGVVVETGAAAAGALSPYVSINSTSGLQVQNLPPGLVNCSVNFRYALD